MYNANFLTKIIKSTWNKFRYDNCRIKWNEKGKVIFRRVEKFADADEIFSTKKTLRDVPREIVVVSGEMHHRKATNLTFRAKLRLRTIRLALGISIT